MELKHIYQSDNLSFVRDPAQARAAIRFAKSIQDGTAFAPAVSGGGEAIVCGSRIWYRAIGGGVYDAVIGGVRDIDHIDIDVIVPGCQERVRLTNIYVTREPE